MNLRVWGFGEVSSGQFSVSFIQTKVRIDFNSLVVHFSRQLDSKRVADQTEIIVVV